MKNTLSWNGKNPPKNIFPCFFVEKTQELIREPEGGSFCRVHYKNRGFGLLFRIASVNVPKLKRLQS